MYHLARSGKYSNNDVILPCVHGKDVDVLDHAEHILLLPTTQPSYTREAQAKA